MLELLEKAAASAATDHPGDALAPLLAAWEKVRAPALADAIEAVSARVTAGRSPPAGKMLRERQAAWLELARAARPEDVGVLLKDFVAGLKSPVALERITALATFPPDPRIARALADLAAVPPFQAGTTRPFWKKLFPMLVDHADPRTLERLAPLSADYVRLIGAETMGTFMKGALDAALNKLRERFPGGSTPALPPEAEALVASLLALAPARSPVVGESTRTEAEFLRAIAADPGDDAPRLVYADWLLEKGDPRGDFIALQYRRHRGEALTPKDQKREADLVAKHRATWLGPVYTLLKPGWKSCRFERGFLAVALVTGVNQLAIDAAAGHPVWSTVEEMTLWDLARRDYACLFEGAAFAALRVLRGATPAMVAKLANGPAAATIEELQVWLPADRQATLDALERLPRLRALTLPSAYSHALQGWAGPERFGPGQGAAAYRWLWSLPLVQRLERLRTAVEHGLLGGVLADILGTSFPRTIELDIPLGGYATYGRLTASCGADGRRTAVTLHRDASYSLPPATLAALDEALGRFPGAALQTV
jgi:uncharacterized protein (TIGR02996 family)